MSEPLIRDVSDTAFWVAHHRAVENERSDALFRDPFAALLAGEHGEEIADSMPNSKVTGWVIVMRTCIIDEFIRSAVAEGIDTIVNLGAGLDTRPYRMELPASLRWIEADYPRVIDYKENLLANQHPHCRLERVKIDLADLAARRQLFANLDSTAHRLLVLTEGVVPYLSLEEAGMLADDLRAVEHLSYWLLDYFSKQSMAFRKRQNMSRKMQNAPFRFVPDDWFAFFEQHGWATKSIRYLADEGERTHRPIPLPWPMKAMMKFLLLFAPGDRRDGLRKFAGFVLLEPR